MQLAGVCRSQSLGLPDQRSLIGTHRLLVLQHANEDAQDASVYLPLQNCFIVFIILKYLLVKLKHFCAISTSLQIHGLQIEVGTGS